MKPTFWKPLAMTALVPLLLAIASTADAQPAAAESPWSFEAAVGWDNGISGNINSSGIGRINNQVAVVTANTYEDVYGTGLHLRFGGAYALNRATEVTGNLTFQSLDADQVTPMGDLGVSNLYAQYTDYQTWGLDVGLRRYMDLTPAIRAYGEGSIGIGFIDETDVTLVAPGANLAGTATDFYDQTAAFAFGANVGLMFQTAGRLGYFGQLGLRWMSGMSEVDNLQATGLDDINDKSSRWTLPFLAGVRVRF
jgi:hypothetical protein